MKLWRNDEVRLNDLFTRDPVDGGGLPLLYRVIAIMHDPVVVLVPADERDGDEREHHVIVSPNFSEFRKVVSLEPGERIIDPDDLG